MDIQKLFISKFCSCDPKEKSKPKSSGQCKKGQKSFVGSLFSRKPKEPEKECPHLVPELPDPDCEPKPESKCDAAPDKSQDKPSAEMHCYTCYIQEQNPLAPPCCYPKIEESSDEEDGPCPPPGCRQATARAPSCCCELCQKDGYHGRCCDGRTYVRTAAEEPPRLEKA